MSLTSPRFVRIIACLLAFTVSGCSCRSSIAQSHLERARNFLFQHRPEAALEDYLLAMQSIKGDTSPSANLYRARALRGAADTYYLELRDYKNAKAVYQELIQLCPEEPETLEGRIRLAQILHDDLHDTRGAIAEITAALARNPPQSAELSYLVAKYYFEIRDFRQCELEATRVEEKYETSSFVDDAILLRAQALTQMEGKQNEAVRVYQNLLMRFPESELAPYAQFELGQLFSNNGEPEKAIEAWIVALKTHPQPEVVQGAIARLRKKMESTTPQGIGDASKAFDRDLNAKRAAQIVRVAKPKTSIEAVGGTAEEAERELHLSGDGSTTSKHLK